MFLVTLQHLQKLARCISVKGRDGRLCAAPICNQVPGKLKTQQTATLRYARPLCYITCSSSAPMGALNEQPQRAAHLCKAAGGKRKDDARGALRQVVVHLRRQLKSQPPCSQPQRTVNLAAH